MDWIEIGEEVEGSGFYTGDGPKPNDSEFVLCEINQPDRNLYAVLQYSRWDDEHWHIPFFVPGQGWCLQRGVIAWCRIEHRSYGDPITKECPRY